MAEDHAGNPVVLGPERFTREHRLGVCPFGGRRLVRRHSPTEL